MVAIVDCLVIESGPFSAVSCLLQLLCPFGYMFLRQCLVDVLCASLFLSEWETVERIYRGKDLVEKTCFLVIGYYMVLMCVNEQQLWW